MHVHIMMIFFLGLCVTLLWPNLNLMCLALKSLLTLRSIFVVHFAMCNVILHKASLHQAHSLCGKHRKFIVIFQFEPGIFARNVALSIQSLILSSAQAWQSTVELRLF